MKLQTHTIIGIWIILLTEGRAENNHTHDFIKYTNCLEINKVENKDTGVVSPEYGDIPTFTISIPEGSDVPGCENIAQCFSPDKITIKIGRQEWL